MASTLYRVRALFPAHTRVTERVYFTVSVSAARRAAAVDGALSIFQITPYRQHWLTQEYLGPAYAQQFLQAIRFQISAGVPPGKAVQFAIEAEPLADRRARLHSATDVLQRGGSIADALMATGMYDQTAYTILLAGERIGALQAISGALAYMEDRKSAWKQLAAVGGLLAVELSTALSVPWTIERYALPWIRENLPRTDPTKLAEHLARLEHIGLLNHYWMIFSYVATACLVALILAWFANPQWRDWLAQNWVRRIPLISTWLEHDALARSGGMFATMLENGVRASDAVDTLRHTSSNPVVSQLWNSISQAIRSGASIGQAIANGGILRPDEAMATASTRGVAQLARAFRSIAENRQWQGKRTATLIVQATVGLTILYIGINVLLVMELFKLFNEGLDLGMSSFANGF